MYCTVYTERKEIKCSGDSEILHEIVRDTAGISPCFPIFVQYHALFRAVSRNPRYTSFPFFNSVSRKLYAGGCMRAGPGVHCVCRRLCANISSKFGSCPPHNSNSSSLFRPAPLPIHCQKRNEMQRGNQDTTEMSSDTTQIIS